MIAALFVDPKGAYAGVEDVEVWDEARDARTYAGPWPVVAHPPCQLWTNFAALNYKRWGGAHNRPGNDRGCFKAALSSVRRWGGVLEHPAFSHAWERYGLWWPNRRGWCHWGDGDGRRHWVCEVWQSAYGHKARKRTWLYAVTRRRPAELRWLRRPGDAQCGWFDRIKPTLSKREASATPTPFRDALIALARGANEDGE